MEANSAVENEHLKVEIKMTFLDKCDEDFFNAKFYQFQKESVIHFLSEFQSHFLKIENAPLKLYYSTVHCKIYLR